ncbi:MAG: hypothetical protein PVF58_19965 [Candidatus Methanofastidiosia archaeon]|jgi:hypothetical protein
MRYGIILVVLLFALCLNQAEDAETPLETPALPSEGSQTIPHSVIKDTIRDYLSALNNRDVGELKSLTHPYYESDIPLLLDYVKEEKITFTVVSISFLMDADGFREMTTNLSDEDFAEQVGKRGLSYELILKVTKGEKTYEDFVIFVEVGETETGWKIVDPELLQLLIESELEVLELEEE